MMAAAESTAPSAERPRVLIVDDNDAMLARVAAVLGRCCTVLGAVKDGRAALTSALTLQPDVVVLDISMPGMSGLEVAARLRQAGSSAEVVFFTVHDDPEFLDAARAAGGLGYVVKPRLASDLPLAVREARAHRPFTSSIG
jgi:DNA-binding NarL/FixJ family response regulator